MASETSDGVARTIRLTAMSQDRASSRIQSSPRAAICHPATAEPDRPGTSRSCSSPCQMNRSPTVGTSPNIARAHCSGVAAAPGTLMVNTSA